MHFTGYGLDFQEVSSDFFQVQLCPRHFGTVSLPTVRIGYLIMFSQKSYFYYPFSSLSADYNLCLFFIIIISSIIINQLHRLY